MSSRFEKFQHKFDINEFCNSIDSQMTFAVWDLNSCVIDNDI